MEIGGRNGRQTLVMFHPAGVAIKDLLKAGGSKGGSRAPAFGIAFYDYVILNIPRVEAFLYSLMKTS